MVSSREGKVKGLCDVYWSIGWLIVDSEAYLLGQRFSDTETFKLVSGWISRKQIHTWYLATMGFLQGVADTKKNLRLKGCEGDVFAVL